MAVKKKVIKSSSKRLVTKKRKRKPLSKKKVIVSKKELSFTHHYRKSILSNNKTWYFGKIPDLKSLKISPEVVAFEERAFDTPPKVLKKTLKKTKRRPDSRVGNDGDYLADFKSKQSALKFWIKKNGIWDNYKIVDETTHTPSKKYPIKCQLCSTKFFNKTEEESIEWLLNNLKCKNCGESFCSKPDSEREYFELQNEYLKKGRKTEPLSKLCKDIIPYAHSLTYKKYGGLMGDENQEEFVHKAVYDLCVAYQTREDFMVTGSFSGFFRYKFMQLPIPEFHFNDTDSIHRTDESGEEFVQLQAPEEQDHDDIQDQKEILVKNVVGVTRDRSMYKDATETEHLLKVLSLWHQLEGYNPEATTILIPDTRVRFIRRALAEVKTQLVPNARG